MLVVIFTTILYNIKTNNNKNLVLVYTYETTFTQRMNLQLNFHDLCIRFLIKFK